MKKRSTKLFVEDIITFFERIEKYIQDCRFESFQKNQMVIDAVVRNLELIGEAANNVPKEITQRYSNIPWSDIKGLRIIAAHGYFKVDLNIIWDIIKKNIPKTKPKILERYNELYKKKERNQNCQ